MRILITGATGIIGSRLVENLTSNRDVRTLGHRAPSREGIEHVQADLLDADAVASAASGADVIVHLAGILEGRDSFDTLEVNLRGTYNVLEAARRQDVDRVVFASSIAVTGCLAPSFVPDYVPILETDSCRPASAYAASKLAAEVLCASHSRQYGLSTIALRIAGVQSPEDWLEPPWETQRSPILWTWISARDASMAVIAAVDAPVDGPIVINVAAGDTCSLRPTRDLVDEFLPGAAIRDVVDPSVTRWPLFDLRRSRAMLDWEARDRFADFFT